MYQDHGCTVKRSGACSHAIPSDLQIPFFDHLRIRDERTYMILLSKYHSKAHSLLLRALSQNEVSVQVRTLRLTVFDHVDGASL